MKYLMFYNFKMYAVNLAQKAKELKREKRKSDSLLFQMLPPSVAMQLKQTQQVRSITFLFKNTFLPSPFQKNVID